MGESAVNSAAQWLGKLMVEEMQYLGAVTSKVEVLKTELDTLAAFLTDVGLRSHHQNNVVRTTLLQAGNIAYDCEDVIERYILQVARHGYEDSEGCDLSSFWRWGYILRKASHVHEIRSKIDQLNERITALKGRIVSYGVSDRIVAAEMNPSVGYQAEPPREFFPHEKEEVVGLETQLKELGDMLLDPTDHRVIVICGMGGIGKSMLARELYNLPKLRAGGSFQAFGWAAASQQFKGDQVLKTLLRSLVPETDHENRKAIEAKISNGKAHEALLDQMTRVKCLVVVDDLWTWGNWEKLQPAFPMDAATGSRILLTTRNKDVLSRLDLVKVHLHPIDALDATNSWDLFNKTAFPGASCPDDKKELGEEMLKHCKGVPLAIVVLAKVMKRKQRVEDWIQMRNNIFSQIQRGGAPGLYKEVYDVLQVSYDELPYHLKHCFLHLANFPEDYEISKEKLYQLWVAERIVSKEEDIAERYLNELVSRSMVQVHQTTSIEKCRIHDLMRDVCIEIAKREGFLQIINCQGPMLLSNMDTKSSAENLLMTSLPERDKRLRCPAVYVTDCDDQESQRPSTLPISTSAKVLRDPSLRSLLFFVRKELKGEKENKKLVEAISNDFPLLRVLDCKGLQINGELPKKVAKLVHLRYLGLVDTRVTKLPSSIEMLQWLETLDLRVGYDSVLSLPNVLWKMKQLRHVYLPHFPSLTLQDRHKYRPMYSIKGGGLLRLDGLCNLQTLINIDLDKLNVEGLKMLKKRLKMVSATCETNELEALDHLFHGSSSMKSCTLRLHARILTHNGEILSNCKAMRCHLTIHEAPSDDIYSPQPLSLESIFLPDTLVSLDIWYVNLMNDPMPVLEKLSNLVVLGLHACYDGPKMACSAGGFPELIDLYFDYLHDFEDWEVEQGALLKLKGVWIWGGYLNKIPDTLPSSANVVHRWRPDELDESRS